MVEDVLAVVHHEQGPAIRQVAHQSGGVGGGRAHGGGGGPDHLVGGGGGGELDQPDPVVEADGGRGCRDGEAGLAHPARAGQGDQPLGLHQLGQLGELVVAADQAGQLQRQVGRYHIGGTRRREVAVADLEDLLCCGHIGQAVQPEAGHRGGGIEQRRRGRRAQDLAAVGDGHEPGGTVERRAEVVPVALFGLPGVDPDPHRDGRPLRPQLDGQGALSGDGGRDGVAGTGELGGQTVAAGGEHVPAVAVDRACAGSRRGGPTRPPSRLAPPPTAGWIRRCR